MTELSKASADVPPGAQLLGREWLGFDGEITSIRFEAKPLFTNRHGTIQGGFLAAMLDSATRQRLQEELFEQWLAPQLLKATIDLNLTGVAG